MAFTKTTLFPGIGSADMKFRRRRRHRFESLEDRRLLAISVVAFPSTFPFSATGDFSGTGPGNDSYTGTFFESGEMVYSGGDGRGYMRNGIGEATGSGIGSGEDDCSSYAFSFSGNTGISQVGAELTRIPAGDPEFDRDTSDPDCDTGGGNLYEIAVAGQLNPNSFEVTGEFSSGAYSGMLQGNVTFNTTTPYDVSVSDAEWSAPDSDEFYFVFDVQGRPQRTPEFSTPVSEVAFYWAFDEEGSRKVPIAGFEDVPIFWNSAGGSAIVSGLPKTANGATHLAIVADPNNKVPDSNRGNNIATLPLVEFLDVVGSARRAAREGSICAYLPGIPLDNMFNVDLHARGYDFEQDQAKMGLQYSFAGSGIGMAEQFTDPPNSFFFFQDMGQVSSSDHALQLWFTYGGMTVGTWRGSIRMARNLNFNMLVDYGAGTAEVEDLRVIGADDAGEGDITGEGEWPVTITIPALPLATAYQDLELVLVQKGGAETEIELTKDGTSYLGMLDAESLEDRNPRNDYWYKLLAKNLSSKSKNITRQKPLKVVSLPAWLRDADPAVFADGVYQLDVHYEVSMEEAVRSVDETGLFSGKENTASLTADVTVMATPDTEQTPAAELERFEIEGAIAGNDVPKTDLKAHLETVEMELNPDTLDLDGDLLIKTHEKTLLSGSSSMFDSADSKMKLPDIAGSALKAAGSLASIGLVSLDLDVDIDAEGEIIGQAGVRVRARDKSVEIVKGDDSFIRLAGTADARLDATLSAGLLGTSSCGVANAQVTGSLLGQLRGEIFVGLSGSIGGSGAGFSAEFEEEKSGLGLGIGYSLELQHSYLCGLIEGETLRLGPGVKTWNLLGGKNFRGDIRKAIKSGEGIFKGFPKPEPPQPALPKRGGPRAAEMFDLSHREQPPRGAMELLTPVGVNTQEVAFSVIGSADRTSPTGDAHHLDVVLRDIDGAEIVIGSWDLADWDYTVSDDPFPNSTGVQDLSVLIPVDELAADRLYSVHIELYRSAEAADESVDVSIDNLQYQERTPDALVAMNGIPYEGETVEYGADTSGATMAVLRITNAGNGVLIVQPPQIDGASFRVSNRPRDFVVLSTGEILDLEVELLEQGGPANGQLTIQTNDAQQPEIIVPLAYDGATDFDQAAPEIERFWLRGSDWLAAVPGIDPQEGPVSATSIDQVQVQWSEPVTANTSALWLRDSSGRELEVVDVTHSEDSTTTTWQLAEALPFGNLVATVDTSVFDVAGNHLAESGSQVIRVRSGDLDGDDVVGAADLARLSAELRRAPTVLDPAADLNRDGSVDRGDIVELLTTFGGDARGLTHANEAPRMSAVPDQVIAEGELLALTLAASDPDDGDTLTYEILGGPDAASIGAEDGELRWQTTVDDGPGLYRITVQVVDSGSPRRYDVRAIDVEVREPNLAPAITPQASVELAAGDLLNLYVVAEDANTRGDQVTFELDQAPVEAEVDELTGHLTWQTSLSTTPGEYPITVRATDDARSPLSDTIQFTVTVFEVNYPPVLEAVPLLEISEQQDVDYQLAASDLNPSDDLVFGLGEGAPDGFEVDANTGQLTWPASPTRPSGFHSFTVTVSDQRDPAGTDVAIVQVQIEEVNSDPFFDAPFVGNAVAGEPFELQLTAQDADLPAQTLTYELGDDAPADLLIDPDTGLLWWIPPTGATVNTTFHVNVYDDYVEPGMGTAEVTIQITPEATPPIVSMELEQDTGLPEDGITTEPAVVGSFFDPSPIASVLVSVNSDAPETTSTGRPTSSRTARSC